MLELLGAVGPHAARYTGDGFFWIKVIRGKPQCVL